MANEMTVGDRIKKVRECIGMAQIDLAKKAGIGKQRLYKYENNVVTNIPIDIIETISNILGVSPAYIMGWEKNLSEDNAELIPELLSDKVILESVKKLMTLNKEHRQTICDTIAYWYAKEGH